MFEITPELAHKKHDLLDYFRTVAQESGRFVGKARTQSREEAAKRINSAVNTAEEAVRRSLTRKATEQDLPAEDVVSALLLVRYCSFVAMIEARNEVWPYEYMAFSRRIGELWEPFCHIPFEYAVADIQLFQPPAFLDVKRGIMAEVTDFIGGLNVPETEKNRLQRHYEAVWSFVDSGQINLALDLHFKKNGISYVVDFKSGFGSNEKGNTNRLLLVGTVYKLLGPDFRCALLVRSYEDDNNHYFQTLKRSGVWETYCGNAAYAKIHEMSGYDLKRWANENIDWVHDLNAGTVEHLASSDLLKYLSW